MNQKNLIIVGLSAILLLPALNFLNWYVVRVFFIAAPISRILQVDTFLLAITLSVFGIMSAVLAVILFLGWVRGRPI